MDVQGLETVMNEENDSSISIETFQLVCFFRVIVAVTLVKPFALFSVQDELSRLIPLPRNVDSYAQAIWKIFDLTFARYHLHG